jgi:hypothetical protein
LRTTFADHVVVLDRVGPRVYRPTHELKAGGGASTPAPSGDELASMAEKLGVAPESLTQLVRHRDAGGADYVHEPRRTGEADDHGDVHHAGDGVYEVVPYACSCGDELTTDPTEVLIEWAKHVKAALKLKGEPRYHAVVRLVDRDGVTDADCSCGKSFAAGEDDPTDPGAALASWSDHVAEEVS